VRLNSAAHILVAWLAANALFFLALCALEGK